MEYSFLIINLDSGCSNLQSILPFRSGISTSNLQHNGLYLKRRLAPWYEKRRGGNPIVNACIITMLSHPICLLEALVTGCNPQCLNCRSHQRLHSTVLCQKKAVFSEINTAHREKSYMGKKLKVIKLKKKDCNCIRQSTAALDLSKLVYYLVLPLAVDLVSS